MLCWCRAIPFSQLTRSLAGFRESFPRCNWSAWVILSDVLHTMQRVISEQPRTLSDSNSRSPTEHRVEQLGFHLRRPAPDLSSLAVADLDSTC